MPKNEPAYQNQREMINTFCEEHMNGVNVIDNFKNKSLTLSDTFDKLMNDYLPLNDKWLDICRFTKIWKIGDKRKPEVVAENCDLLFSKVNSALKARSDPDFLRDKSISDKYRSAKNICFAMRLLKLDCESRRQLSEHLEKIENAELITEDFNGFSVNALKNMKFYLGTPRHNANTLACLMYLNKFEDSFL